MKHENKFILWELFVSTLKIGAFTFGGGYAMIPIMEDEFVTKKHWLSEEEMVDVFAVVQSAPGVLAVNSSIYLGYKIAGFLGAMVATLGTILPSFLIIIALSGVYMQFKESKVAMAALTGVRAGVVALILLAVLKLGKRSVSGVFGWSLALAAFFAVTALKLNPIYIIVSAAIIGIAFYGRESKVKKAGDKK